MKKYACRAVENASLFQRSAIPGAGRYTLLCYRGVRRMNNWCGSDASVAGRPLTTLRAACEWKWNEARAAWELARSARLHPIQLSSFVAVSALCWLVHHPNKLKLIYCTPDLWILINVLRHYYYPREKQLKLHKSRLLYTPLVRRAAVRDHFINYSWIRKIFGMDY